MNLDKLKIRRPRMVQAFTYKLIGESGVVHASPASDPFPTEAKAEADAKRKIAAFSKAGKEIVELAFETRLVPSSRMWQKQGMRLVLNADFQVVAG